MSKSAEPIPGKRINVDAVVMTKRPGQNGKYGESTIYSLVDFHSERKFGWEASEGSTKLNPGERVQIKGTVKEIGADGRVILTRCRKA